MEIDFLYVPDCPNRMVARHRLDQALERTGLGGAMVREHEVDSSEEAAERGMRGSPTILIDGADPFADPAQATSCPAGSTPAMRVRVAVPRSSSWLRPSAHDSGRTRCRRLLRYARAGRWSRGRRHPSLDFRATGAGPDPGALLWWRSVTPTCTGAVDQSPEDRHADVG